MPSFAHPWVLLLLGLVPALAWWQRRREPAALAFPLTNLGHDAPSRRLVLRGRVLPVLLWLTGLCLIFGLSGPRIPDPGSRIETEGIALGLVVDVSGSMATEDFTWAGQPVSRLAAVQSVFRLLVAGGTSPDGLTFTGRPRDLITLVTFATRPETVAPLTHDHTALLHQLDRLKPKTFDNEATTNPGDALAWALDGVRRSPTRRKAIVFLTDGEANVAGSALKPLEAGQLAAALGVPIYTVDALTETDTNGDIDRAHKTLENLARLTGGQYFKAGDGPALAAALHDLDRLERDQLTTSAYRRYFDLTLWFAGLGLLAWLAHFFYREAWWRVAPK
jgi:Ca-activated chloride channel family protein